MVSEPLVCQGALNTYMSHLRLLRRYLEVKRGQYTAELLDFKGA